MFAPVAIGKSKGYQIPNSIRFIPGSLFSRTPSAGNSTKYTYSTWFKHGSGSFSGSLLSAGTIVNGVSGNYNEFYIGSGQLLFIHYNGTTNDVDVRTAGYFRDVSNWYHFVLVVDTSLTANDRVQIWVNGVRQAVSTNTQPGAGASTTINTATAHLIGRRPSDGFGGTSWNYLDGYLAETYFLDGLAYDSSYFGFTDPSTGQWLPKKYTGTYGSNGFYLDYKDGTSTTTLGYDKSGGAKNWTPSGFVRSAGITDCWTIDSPTKNFPVINTLANTGYAVTITSGGLQASGTYAVAFSNSIAFSSGKWYAEYVYSAQSTAQYVCLYDENGGIGYCADGRKGVNGTYTAYGATWTVGDVIGIAADVDSGTVTFFKNGVSQGQVTGMNSNVFHWFGSNSLGAATANTYNINFGQYAFQTGSTYDPVSGGWWKYAPPAGYKAVCLNNLPTPKIKNPKKHFDIVLRNGFGATGGSVSSLQFQPGLYWEKRRNSTASQHFIIDVGRGVSKMLSADTTSAETTNSTYLTSFNSNGYTLGSGDFISTDTLVEWLWNVPQTSATINVNQYGTTPSISSQVYVNSTAGFSVVTWTEPASGAYTVGHGLPSSPSFVIEKQTSGGVANWAIWHKGLTASQYLQFNANAAGTSTTIWQNTLPSSTLLYGTAGNAINVSQSAVAYCFMEVPGFSRFGTYLGNNSSDGPFVFCGFRPRYILTKAITASGTPANDNWIIHDTSRDPVNKNTSQWLYANLSNIEGAAGSSSPDILSNGFKMRGITGVNDAGVTYLFAAFAESPFKYSNAR